MTGYTIDRTITATSGALQHTVTASLTVSSLFVAALQPVSVGAGAEAVLWGAALLLFGVPLYFLVRSRS